MFEPERSYLIVLFVLRTRKIETQSILNSTEELSSTPNNTSHRVLFSADLDSITNSWSSDVYVYVYGGIMFALFSIALVRSLSLFHLCVSSSQNLHDNMFKGLISTSMRFFDVNSSGRIMNRFSKDMG